MEQGKAMLQDQVDPFALVADELSYIGDRLRSMVVAEVPKLATAAEYFFKMGLEGKRFRPTVLLLMAIAIDGPITRPPSGTTADELSKELRTRQQSIAEITEMIHVASLLHDDVLDDADIRRGVSSLNFVMGNKVGAMAYGTIDVDYVDEYIMRKYIIFLQTCSAVQFASLNSDMFDILFGWRKASKCKRLIRKVQCRLKLLKNKRCAIVRQLRDDIAQLLKQGHAQTALDRVEHVFKDENLVAVYDLLDQFCEFIIINLPYIRRNKDCPNDINEAASTIIFASARLGELPELRGLRKLFGERYGQRFANVALQLLPGNLVNRQMQEKVCLKHVPDEAKSRLLSEIARSNFQSEPLLIEYSSESQQLLASKTSPDPSLSIITVPVENGDKNPGDPDINKGEKESVYFEISSEAKRLLKHLVFSFLRSKIVFPLINLKTESSVVSKHEDTMINSIQSSKPLESGTIPCLEKAKDKVVNHTLSLTFEKENPTVKSSSANLPEEPVFLDDIQEFKSSQVKDEESLQDQRVFMFSPNAEKEHQGLESAYQSDHESGESRSLKKSPGKRLRRKNVSIDIPKNVKDVECAMYYGESCENLTHSGSKLPRERRNHQKKIPMKQEANKSYYVHKSPKISISIVNSREEKHRCSSKNTNSSSSCSLEQPCYFCTSDETDDTSHSPTFPKIQCTICYYHQCSCKKKTDIKVKNAETDAFVFSCSKEEECCNEKKMESKKPTSYSRADTMPVERVHNDSYLRSNSFPIEQPGRSPSNPHVHPKLPDYDELAAKFTALKKATLQNQTPPQKRFK